MHALQLRGAGRVERGAHAHAPLPALIESLYIRFGAPRQAVEPAAGHEVDLVHRQVAVERVVEVERQERRPQLFAVALLLHAVHLGGLGNGGGAMLDTGQGFGIVQKIPQRRGVHREQHVAVHEKCPAAHAHLAAQLGHEESRMAELGAERAAVALVVGLPGRVRDPRPAEKCLFPQWLMLQQVSLDGALGEAVDIVLEDERGFMLAVIVPNEDVVGHVAILPQPVARPQHPYRGR